MTVLKKDYGVISLSFFLLSICEPIFFLGPLNLYSYIIKNNKDAYITFFLYIIIIVILYHNHQSVHIEDRIRNVNENPD